MTANFFYYYLLLKDIEIYTNGIQGDGLLRHVCFLTMAATIYKLKWLVFFLVFLFRILDDGDDGKSFLWDHKIGADVDATADEMLIILATKKEKKIRNEMNEKVKGEWGQRATTVRRSTHVHLNTTTATMNNNKLTDANSSIVFNTHNYICAHTRTPTHANAKENHNEKKHTLTKFLIMQTGAWAHYYLLQLLFYYKRKCGSHLASTPHRDNNGIITTQRWQLSSSSSCYSGWQRATIQQHHHHHQHCQQQCARKRRRNINVLK